MEGRAPRSVPERFNFTRDVLEQQARRYPRRPALRYIEDSGVIHRMDFGELASRSARWANLMVELGCQPGERVLVAVGLDLDWPAIVLGALKCGVLPVPCNETLRADEFADLVVEADAAMVIASRRAEQAVEAMKPLFQRAPNVFLVEQVRDQLQKQPSDAPTCQSYADYFALVILSEGVGGVARAVLHTHAYTHAHAAIAEEWLDIRSTDTVLMDARAGSSNVVPLTILAPWWGGAEVVLHAARFDPGERLELVERFGMDVLCQPAEHFLQLAELDDLSRFDLSRTRHLASFGRLLPKTVHDRFRDELGVAIHEGYGTAETSTIVANAPGKARPGSLGCPLGGSDIAIVDPSGYELPWGHEGHIALASGHPTLFAGYLSGSEMTSKTAAGSRYVTDRLAVCDADGYFWPSPAGQSSAFENVVPQRRPRASEIEHESVDVFPRR